MKTGFWGRSFQLLRIELLSLAVPLLAALWFAGCDDPMATSGGPGATSDLNKQPTLGQPSETFKLDAPNLETDIRKAETAKVNILIHRGEGFDQDVRLQFGDLPKGVTIEPTSPIITHSDPSAVLIFHVAKDAAIGHHTINVTGTPTREGAAGATSFKIEVLKAE